MPYIPAEDRTKLDAFIEGLSRNVDSKGELTYALTMLVLGYVDKHGKSYDSYSDVIGCLGCTTQEIYRVEVSKYEDVKKVQNGPLKRTEYITVNLRDRCDCEDPLDCPTFATGDHSSGCRLRHVDEELERKAAIKSRRCPCGAGVDRCESETCIGSEGTTTGGW